MTHVWHPDPLHPDNRPGAVIDYSEGPYPFRHRHLTVTAPGIIDAVDEEDGIFGDEDDDGMSTSRITNEGWLTLVNPMSLLRQPGGRPGRIVHTVPSSKGL